MSTRIALTGATGFVGGALAARLLEDPTVQLRVACRDPSKAGELAAAGVQVVPFDLSDPATFPGVVTGQHIVVHCAAWLGGGDPAQGDTLNRKATRQLAEAAAGADAARFVFVSSIAAYGIPPSDTVRSDTPVDPSQRDAYGRSKAQAELALQEVAQSTGMAAVIVRPGIVHGPGGRLWTRGLYRRVQKGSPLLVGAGAGHAPAVYLDNLVALLLRAIHAESAPQAPLLAVDPPVTWADFLAHYATLSGTPLRRIPAPIARLIAAIEPWFPASLPLDANKLALLTRPIVYDTTLTETLTGWRAETTLPEAMAANEAWLRAERLL